MYEFSMPMPYKAEFTDKIVNINNEINKSKISNFYFCLPLNSPERTCFEQSRTAIPDLATFKDWSPIIEKSQSSGFHIIYLLNSPKPLLFDLPFFEKQLNSLDKLIKNLRLLGINKLRITNPLLINYVLEKYSDMEVLASTSLEYTQISQYRNLMTLFPDIKQLVPSHDVSKNFRLLKNIKKLFPNLKIEIMVQEGCIKGCPLRNFHAMSPPYNFSQKFLSNKNLFSKKNFQDFCWDIYTKDIVTPLFFSNFIMPWELQAYSEIGINNFKFVGRDALSFFDGNFDNILNYLKGADDINNIADYPITKLIHRYSNIDINITVKEIMPFLPKIDYFKKHGHLCASSCGTDCKYCYNCLKKFKKFL